MSRYIFIPDLNQLKNESLNEKKFLLEELKRMAGQYESQILPEMPPEGSTTYMGMAIFNLSLLYLITDDIKYANEAKRWMKTVVSYDVWGFAHLVNVDLSASWILFGLSLGYHYLYDVLSNTEKVEIYDKLVKHGTIMYDYRVSTYGNGWSTQYFQNHNWINLTGLATAGYVLKESHKEAKDWVDAARENFTHVYPNLADDGSNYEGVAYWHYGVLWLYIYADLLENREGYDYFKHSDFLKYSVDYKMAQTLPDLKHIINFGDCHDYRSGHSIAIYFKNAAKYNNQFAQYLGRYVFDNFYLEEQESSHLKPGITCEIGLALLWFNASIKEKNTDEMPQYSYFEDLGLTTLKTGNRNASKMFSIKCEKPGGNKQFFKIFEYLEKDIHLFGLSHHHPDNTHYILTKDDEYYVIDDGYNRILGMKHHNVITAGDYGLDVEFVTDPYSSSIKKRIKDGTMDKLTYGGHTILSKHIDDILFYKAENAGVYHYDAKMIKAERLIVSPDLEYIIMRDMVKSNKSHAYKWHFHTSVDPQINDNQMIVSLKSDLRVQTIYPKTFHRVHEVQRIKSVYTTQEPNNFRLLDMVDSIIQSDFKNEEMFLNVLSFDEVIINDMSDYIEINVNGRTDIFVFNSCDKFTTDSDFVFIKDYQGMNAKVYINAGKTLLIDGKLVLQYEIL